jgi:SEC-C motif-containing protein
MTPSSTACPCGSSRSYADCCGPWHSGAPAPDAEALMRSRYSAYVLGRKEYLLGTWHASTRPARLDVGPGASAKWLGLEVIRHESTGADRAIVEFVARFKSFGFSRRLHEISRFVRIDGRWFYVDGD